MCCPTKLLDQGIHQLIYIFFCLTFCTTCLEMPSGGHIEYICVGVPEFMVGNSGKVWLANRVTCMFGMLEMLCNL